MDASTIAPLESFVYYTLVVYAQPIRDASTGFSLNSSATLRVAGIFSITILIATVIGNPIAKPMSPHNQPQKESAINTTSGLRFKVVPANRGSIKPVSWLLDHGADPNAIDDNGRTPLHVAAIRNTATRAIEILLGRGADASRVDADGRTALDHARDNKRLKVVALLEGVVRDS